MIRSSAAFLLALGLLSVSANAQAPAAVPAPPVLPMLTNYSFWTNQYLEFVGDELPYSMINIDVDSSGKKPLVRVVLTSKDGKKRTIYTDSELLLAQAKGAGEEAYKVALAFEPADTENVGSVTSVRFTMPDGKPLQFRFVQGSDVSQQGSGLNPFPGVPIPIFAYRELGAVAGEGTALQIGDVAAPAPVWKEISKPPYFVGYRGAMTSSSHTLVFTPGKDTWTIKSSPATLATGGAWELDSDKGNHRTVRIVKAEGAHVTVSSTERFAPGVHCLVEAGRNGDGWTIEQARFSPDKEGEKHYVTLAFAPALTTPADKVAMTLTAGKKTTLSTATITSAEGGAKVSFATPDWLAGKSMTESVMTAPGALTFVAHP